MLSVVGFTVGGSGHVVLHRFVALGFVPTSLVTVIAGLARRPDGPQFSIVRRLSMGLVPVPVLVSMITGFMLPRHPLAVSAVTVESNL